MTKADVDYPDNFPLPLLSGRSIDNVDPMQKTSMASGRTRYRRRFKSTPSSVSVTFIMRNEQSERFRGWYEYELNGGVNWFNMRLRVDNGIKDVVAHFDGIYSGPNPEGFLGVSYTATIVLYERPVPTEDRYALIQLLGYDSYADALAALDDVNPHWDPQYWDRAVGMVGEPVNDSIVRMNDMNTRWLRNSHG